VSTLLEGVRRWQVFLSAARAGLGIEEQRGLFGELLLLEKALVPRMGAQAATRSWKGFARAQQDFQFRDGAIEVKTTAAAGPYAVKITSERQLDDRGSGRLFLHVIVVDDREVPASSLVGGDTLAGLVEKARSAVRADPVALALLDDGLLEAGWLDAHASRYEGRRLTVREELSFQVGEGFPRLVEHSLPRGVARVSYHIDLNVCRAFAVSTEAMLVAVGGEKAARPTRRTE
jgi:hypothetical protein